MLTAQPHIQENGYYSEQLLFNDTQIGYMHLADGTLTFLVILDGKAYTKKVDNVKTRLAYNVHRKTILNWIEEVIS